MARARLMACAEALRAFALNAEAAELAARPATLGYSIGAIEMS
jgi:hypothetical protein